jgi:hypothetical protein
MCEIGIVAAESALHHNRGDLGSLLGVAEVGRREIAMPGEAGVATAATLAAFRWP